MAETGIVDNQVGSAVQLGPVDEVHCLSKGSESIVSWVNDIMKRKNSIINSFAKKDAEGSDLVMLPQDFEDPIYQRSYHFIQSTIKTDQILEYLRACPVQIAVCVSLQALFLSRTGNVDGGIQVLKELELHFRMFESDVTPHHDVSGLNSFISLNMNALRKEFGKTDEVVQADENVPIADSTLLACKLFVYMLYREPMDSLMSMCSKITKLSCISSETFFLVSECHRKRRLQSYVFLSSPTKKEFVNARKGLALQPSNLCLRVTCLRLLFDGLRSSNFNTNLTLFRIPLRNREIITAILHEELQLAIQETLPGLFGAEVMTIASEFYAYRNLRNIMCRPLSIMDEGDDATEVGYFEAEDEGWPMEDFNLREMVDSYMQGAERWNPLSVSRSKFTAYQLLQEGKLSEAIETLKPLLQFDRFDADIVQLFIRILIGGPAALRPLAYAVTNKAIAVSEVSSWSDIQVSHLYFLKATIELFSGDMNQVLESWKDGFERYPREFLAQFVYWSKRQCRKYMWPSVLTEFATISNLKSKLMDKCCVDLTNDNSDQADDLLIYASLLEELNICFPLVSEVEGAVFKLKEEWGYLLEGPPVGHFVDSETESDSDLSPSEDEDEPPQKIPVIVHIPSRPANSEPNVWMF